MKTVIPETVTYTCDRCKAVQSDNYSLFAHLSIKTARGILEQDLCGACLFKVCECIHVAPEHRPAIPTTE